MQLTQFTDYSLRVLMYVCQNQDKLVSTADICEFHFISKNHLLKVVNKLGGLGYVELKRGRGGGLRLNMDPHDINIGTLVTQIEPHMDIIECFNRENNTCVITKACKLKPIFKRAQNAFIEELRNFTLADVVNDPGLLG